MIDIGKSVHLRVIAEGVETRAQLEFLQSHGCTEGQGYYFSRPVPADQASKLLESAILRDTQGPLIPDSGRPMPPTPALVLH